MNRFTSIKPLTIANGQSLSGAIDLGQGRAVRLLLPSAWTAADLTVQTSPDDGVYNNLFDAAGNEYTIKAAASRAVILPLADFIGVRYLKLRSGASGAPVNQGADRVLTVIAVPV